VTTFLNGSSLRNMFIPIYAK